MKKTKTLEWLKQDSFKEALIDNVQYKDGSKFTSEEITKIIDRVVSYYNETKKKIKNHNKKNEYNRWDAYTLTVLRNRLSWIEREHPIIYNMGDLSEETCSFEDAQLLSACGDFELLDNEELIKKLEICIKRLETRLNI